MSKELTERIERLEKRLDSFEGRVQDATEYLAKLAGEFQLQLAPLVTAMEDVCDKIATLERKLENHRHAHRPPDGDTAWETSKPIFDPPEPEAGAEKAAEPKA